MRLVVAALVGLVFWGFAAGASAQNGLQRFESDIKPQLEVKKFTYGSASALGSAGFLLLVFSGSGVYGIEGRRRVAVRTATPRRRWRR